MRQRRDPFARITLVPVPMQHASLTCDWCGTPRAPRRPIYALRQESDGGRSSVITGGFCSWSCAEAYHGTTLGGPR